MSFIIDLIILAVAAAAIYHGIAKGFIKSGMRFASIVIAIVCVFVFTSPLSAWLDGAFVKEYVSDVAEDTFDSIINAGAEKLDLDEIFEDSPEALTNFADRFNFDLGEVEEYYHSVLDGLTQSEALTALSEKIAAPTSAAISTVSAAIIIFALAIILCLIATYILELLCRLPVLKQLNKVLGGVFGAGSALLGAWSIANIAVGAVNALETLNGGIFNNSVISGSFILRFFVESGLILF